MTFSVQIFFLFLIVYLYNNASFSRKEREREREILYDKLSMKMALRFLLVQHTLSSFVNNKTVRRPSFSTTILGGVIFLDKDRQIFS